MLFEENIVKVNNFCFVVGSCVCCLEWVFFFMGYGGFFFVKLVYRWWVVYVFFGVIFLVISNLFGGKWMVNISFLVGYMFFCLWDVVNFGCMIFNCFYFVWFLLFIWMLYF